MRRNMAHLERERDDALVKRAVTNVEVYVDIYFLCIFLLELLINCYCSLKLSNLVLKKNVGVA